MQNPVFPLILALLWPALALGGCSKPAADPPRSGDGGPEIRTSPAPPQETRDYSPLLTSGDPQPHLPPGASETLLQVIDLNLDLDRQEEQILVLRERQTTDSPLSIAILDYDPALKDYRRRWEAQTRITNIRSFSLTLSDLIGDHVQELICGGIGAGGRQVMTVFRRTQEQGLRYVPIFDQQVDGVIEILQLPRSAAYETGLREGESFSILVTIPDPQGQNETDRLKNTYQWDFASRRYIRTKEERLLGSRLRQEQLLAIYRSPDDGAFLNQIQGPWMKNDGSGVIINIDRQNSSLSFYAEEGGHKILDLYIWTGTYRLLNNMIQLNGENELVNHFERILNIRLEDMNNLQITVQDINTQTRARIPNELWSGDYFFLSREVLGGLNPPPPRAAVPVLTGKYSGDNGTELVFSGNRFELSGAGDGVSGGFSLYQSGEKIFTLNILNRYGVTENYRVFKYEFEERILDRSIERTLTLTEGRLLIHGFEAFETPPLKFQQIEISE
ncbi:MAG: pallilysin-related adhesin [Spirochaetales bacterium]|jgi:hypothetical protein|nr:pallilysin-related adhesin [Spirochaetales bacterium]